MKKKLILLIIPFIFLVSCNKPNTKDTTKIKNETSASQKEVKNYSIKDFYPFKENTLMKYTGTGSEFAHKSVYVDYIKDDRIQLRVINSGTATGQVLENKDGELRLITSKEEFYYRDDITDSKNDNYEILLKEPIEKDNSWTLPNGDKRYISSIDKKVKTPAGEYTAIEVTTESNNSTKLDYYVLNTGLVKSIFKTSDLQTETLLEKIDTNTPVNQTIKFYFPDYNNDKIVFVKNTLTFKTNDDLKSKLEDLFKKSPDASLTKLLGNNVKINKLFLDTKTNTVCVDFSSNMVKEMNVGSGLESYILKCLTNTLGDYYNVDKAYITLDGKPYGSGHIILKENEPLYTDYNNITEYK